MDSTNIPDAPPAPVSPRPYAWGYTNQVNNQKGITLDRWHRQVDGYTEEPLFTRRDAEIVAAPQLARLRWIEEKFSQLKTSASERVMHELGLLGDPTESLADLVDRAITAGAAT